MTTTKTVIVADDTAFVRDRFATALLSAGHTAHSVKSAAELLARVRSDLDRLDLIVLDLRLPHAGGVDLVRSIRKMDQGRVPILVFSGTIATAEEVRELAALGVAGYVNEYSAVQHILPSLAPHLFPDNFNRRGSPRVVLGIPINYRFGSTIAAALTLNLSKGGHRDPDDEPAAGRLEGARTVPVAGIEARHRSGVPGGVERSPAGNGPAVREGGVRRPGRDRRVRRSAFLPTKPTEGLKAEPDAALLPQQPQRVGDDDQRRAGVGDDRHPQRGSAARRPAPGTRP